MVFVCLLLLLLVTVTVTLRREDVDEDELAVVSGRLWSCLFENARERKIKS